MDAESTYFTVYTSTYACMCAHMAEPSCSGAQTQSTHSVLFSLPGDLLCPPWQGEAMQSTRRLPSYWQRESCQHKPGQSSKRQLTERNQHGHQQGMDGRLVPQGSASSHQTGKPISTSLTLPGCKREVYSQGVGIHTGSQLQAEKHPHGL